MRCESVMRSVVIIIPWIWTVWFTVYVCSEESYRPQRDSNTVPPVSESTTLPMSYPGAIVSWWKIFVVFISSEKNLISKKAWMRGTNHSNVRVIIVHAISYYFAIDVWTLLMYGHSNVVRYDWTPGRHETMTQRYFNTGPHWNNTGWCFLSAY